ncbi:hypothetical protein G6F40_014914 [Rhizopus arrhizus]|nr:hypothetical protein G6F40_014914 [Rhizopus arrhizus]
MRGACEGGGAVSGSVAPAAGARGPTEISGVVPDKDTLVRSSWLARASCSIAEILTDRDAGQGARGALAHLSRPGLDWSPFHLPALAMALHRWLIYLVAVIGLSITPGPNTLLALTHGALHGHRKALCTIAGGARALESLGAGADGVEVGGRRLSDLAGRPALACAGRAAAARA